MIARAPARLVSPAGLALLSFLFVAVQANAHEICKLERMSYVLEGEEFSAKAFEILLLPTPYRALCGHSIDPDIRFWESMIAYYGCAPNSLLAKFLRHHWTGSIDSRRSGFEESRIKNPDFVARFCRAAGELKYRQNYRFAALKDLLQQFAGREILLPK